MKDIKEKEKVEPNAQVEVKAEWGTPESVIEHAAVTYGGRSDIMRLIFSILGKDEPADTGSSDETQHQDT